MIGYGSDKLSGSGPDALQPTYGRILQQVAAGKDGSYFGEVPLPMQVVTVPAQI